MHLITIISALLSATLAAPAPPHIPSRDQVRVSNLSFQSTDTGIGDADKFQFQLQVGAVVARCNDFAGRKTKHNWRVVDCHNDDFIVNVRDTGSRVVMDIKFLDREDDREKHAWGVAPSYKCSKEPRVKV